MAGSPRISRSIVEFNSYITTTAAYLAAGTPTNASRLGISESEAATWASHATTWVSLYPKYADKKNSRTTAVIDQLTQVIDQTVSFDQTNHILDRIASSVNATITDFETFNIKSGALKKSTRSTSNTPISEAITATLLPIGGGVVQVKCYTSTGQRAGIYDDADSVQYVYTVGTTPPISADAEGLKSGLSTKGSFQLDLGAASGGKYLYIYFRWYDTHYPKLAGPWCALETTLIL